MTTIIATVGTNPVPVLLAVTHHLAGIDGRSACPPSVWLAHSPVTGIVARRVIDTLTAHTAATLRTLDIGDESDIDATRNCLASNVTTTQSCVLDITGGSAAMVAGATLWHEQLLDPNKVRSYVDAATSTVRLTTATDQAVRPVHAPEWLILDTLARLHGWTLRPTGGALTSGEATLRDVVDRAWKKFHQNETRRCPHCRHVLGDRNQWAKVQTEHHLTAYDPEGLQRGQFDSIIRWGHRVLCIEDKDKSDAEGELAWADARGAMVFGDQTQDLAIVRDDTRILPRTHALKYVATHSYRELTQEQLLDRCDRQPGTIFHYLVGQPAKLTEAAHQTIRPPQQRDLVVVTAIGGSLTAAPTAILTALHHTKTPPERAHVILLRGTQTDSRLITERVVAPLHDMGLTIEFVNIDLSDSQKLTGTFLATVSGSRTWWDATCATKAVTAAAATAWTKLQTDTVTLALLDPRTRKLTVTRKNQPTTITAAPPINLPWGSLLNAQPLTHPTPGEQYLAGIVISEIGNWPPLVGHPTLD